MTNKNMNVPCNPFLLKPAGKDYLWGGERLKTEYGKTLPKAPLAESWECSTHEDGLSIVGSGIYEGLTLKEVLQKHPEYMGSHQENNQSARETGELPILVKLIDAKENLSVQVHPDDTYAKTYENGQRGKTEMWYVMDAKKDANLIYGFHHDMEKEKCKEGIETGTIERYLQKVRVHKNDVFYIEAGVVHAIGAGTIIAEIQENSNLTYRLYDYNRIDKNGKKRPLHIEKALQVANRTETSTPRQPLRVLRYQKGLATELLKRCPYFQVERRLLNTEKTRTLAEFRTDEGSFQVYLCIDGCGVLYMEDESLNFFKGDCIFAPANSNILKMHGKAKFLCISC